MSPGSPSPDLLPGRTPTSVPATPSPGHTNSDLTAQIVEAFLDWFSGSQPLPACNPNALQATGVILPKRKTDSISSKLKTNKKPSVDPTTFRIKSRFFLTGLKVTHNLVPFNFSSLTSLTLPQDRPQLCPHLTALSCTVFSFMPHALIPGGLLPILTLVKPVQLQQE